MKKASDSDIDNLIKRTVEKQYGKKQVAAFEQLSCVQKLLLLDDFDDSPMKAADARADLLGALRKRFGHLVITVGDMFEVREMLNGDTSRALITLTHYKMQYFGHALRAQLINRWFSLGADGTVDEATYPSNPTTYPHFFNNASISSGANGSNSSIRLLGCQSALKTFQVSASKNFHLV